MKSNKASFWGLVLFLLACAAAQFISARITLSSVNDWYLIIRKPSWTPQDWIFAPVWTFLYASMAIAGWLVWRKKGEEEYEGFPILLFGLQLVLNVFWSVLFFGTRSPAWAFYEICLLWIVLAFTIVTFNRICRRAAVIMIPYFVWLTYAACLNYAIWRLN